MLKPSPGLDRLRAHPAAEAVREAVLRDQQAALEAAAEWAATKRGSTPLLDSETKSRPAGFLDSSKITVLVAANPKRGKARMRFALYTFGMTVADYKAAVGNAELALADLRWDVRRGFIKVTVS